MKLDELRQYLSLKNDEVYYVVKIKQLERLKDEKVTVYQSPRLTGTPSGSSVTSSTERLALYNIEFAAKIEGEKAEAQKRLQECRERIRAIDDFIGSIPDTETRSMMRRHIKQRVSFNQIAREFFVSRNYVAKRIKEVCDDGKKEKTN